MCCTTLAQSDPCGVYGRRTRAGAYYAHSSVVVSSWPAGTDRKDNSAGSVNGGVGNQILRAYVDPADDTGGEGRRDVPMKLPDGATGYYTTGSYAANGLIPWGGAGGLPKLISDGTANTIMIAERPQVCRTAAGDTVYN